MRKILLIIIGLMIINQADNAQYTVNKTRYDYRTYRYQAGDPYKPVAIGCVSFCIPGMGQFFLKEPLRGAGFFGGFIMLSLMRLKMTNENLDIMPGIVLISNAGLRVWSGIDAARIAKVNNLFYRDPGNTSLDLRLFPYMDSRGHSSAHKNIPAGLTVLITF
jgi:hypothetical protein